MGQTGFLFPGQGAQHVGMGKTIAEQFPAAMSLYERAGRILGFDLARICFEGPAKDLDSTKYSQPAIYVTSLACLEKLKGEKPEVAANCAMAAGLSLGEYTALVFAGAMSFEDGLRVVQRRAELMQQSADANPSGMVSILMLEKEKVDEIRGQASAEGTLEIANLLCPGNVVLSGATAACRKAAELAEQSGGRAVPLAVSGAFHTAIMKPADTKLGEALAGVAMSAPRIPVISNVDAESHNSADELKQILVRQVVSPVLWEKCVRKMLDSGIDEFYEIGPGRVLTGLLKRISRRTPCTIINDTPQ